MHINRAAWCHRGLQRAGARGRRVDAEQVGSTLSETKLGRGLSREQDRGECLQALQLSHPREQVSHQQHADAAPAGSSRFLAHVCADAQHVRPAQPDLDATSAAGVQQAKHSLSVRPGHSIRLGPRCRRTCHICSPVQVLLKLGGGARRKRAKANGPCL